MFSYNFSFSSLVAKDVVSLRVVSIDEHLDHLVILKREANRRVLSLAADAGARYTEEKSLTIITFPIKVEIKVEVHVTTYGDVRRSGGSHPVVKFILVDQSNPLREDRILS